MEADKPIDAQKEIWIFLSHSNEDYEKVRQVRNMLEELNLRPIMFFLKCLTDDDEIDDLIKREIDCRTRFILCDSENARKSKWVQRELAYIAGKQKSYEVVDLALPEDKILEQLNAVKRKTSLFFSCCRADHNLADYLTERLSKYDFDVFSDKNTIVGNGELFENQLKGAIVHALRFGYVIAVVTNRSLDSKWVTEELETALQYDKGQRIIILLMTDWIPPSLSSANVVRLSPYSTKEEVFNALLQKLLRPGDILTYYNNFMSGSNCAEDKNEAAQLGKLYFQLADEANDRNSPSGMIALGHCYEYGIGTNQDLQKALSLYIDYVSNDGLGREHAKRVMRKLNEKSSSQ